MLELAASLLPLLDAGERVAVVTVVGVPRSAPRGVGAAMAVTREGTVIGSISGGCVEGDAVMLATQVLATGRGVTATLGYSDDDAHAAGLACGGSVDVVVHAVAPEDAAAVAALRQAAADIPVRILLGRVGDAVGAVHAAGPDDESDATRAVLAHAPRPRLVIIGAGEHAMALSRVGAAAGWHVAVCDVWERLVSPERFPDADDLIVGLPEDHFDALLGPDAASAAVCVLTHDARVDVPAIVAAFDRGAGFVGAMGARSTVAHRRALLREAGLSDARLDELHSPLGLDLGGSSPDAAAIAVLAEIVAARHGGSGASLRATRGPLHRRVGDATACEITPPPAVSA